MVRNHPGVYQTGAQKGQLKKGYKYSGKKLKSGLPQIVRTKVQKGGQTQERYFENDTRNIVKAKYPNNTTVFFFGTFHHQSMITPRNLELLVHELTTNPNAEMWVEHRSDLDCGQLGRSYLETTPTTVNDALTQEIIRHLPDVRRGNCPRSNMLKGWDRRFELLHFTNNITGEVFDAQQILYNHSIPDSMSLKTFHDTLIARMPYINIQQDAINLFNQLTQNIDPRDVSDKYISQLGLTQQQQRILGQLVDLLQRNFALWADERVHNELLQQQNKTIFVLQGLYHFDHFVDIFLKHIPFEIRQNRLNLN